MKDKLNEIRDELSFAYEELETPEQRIAFQLGVAQSLIQALIDEIKDTNYGNQRHGA